MTRLLLIVIFWLYLNSLNSYLDLPKLIEFSKSFFNQPQGSVFILICNTIDGKSPFEFFWKKNGHPFNTEDARIVIETEDTFSQLMIKNLTIFDSGNFSCFVQNSYGFDSQWTVLQVKGLSY